MSLIDLPEEIIIIIMQYLKLPELHVLYETCSRLRSICVNGTVKDFNMSMNTMATVDSLKLNFFRDIAHNLQSLNMCGVSNLTKTSLLTALKRLKTLKCLDVSYTSINICDLVSIPDCSPTLKDISVNFSFSKLFLETPQRARWSKIQVLFQQFEYIHFVGSEMKLMYSNLHIYLLKNAKLKGLKYTIAEQLFFAYCTHLPLECSGIIDLPELPQFFINVAKSSNTMSMKSDSLFSLINFSKYEFIVLVGDGELGIENIYASQAFHDLLTALFDMEIHENLPTSYVNSVFLLWNKEMNTFDDNFFLKLRKQLKKYVICNFQMPCERVTSNKCNWFYTIVTPDALREQDSKYDESHHFIKKKRRIAPKKAFLDFDRVFKQVEKFELSVVFNYVMSNSISLSVHSNYLNKLTFVSFSDLQIGHAIYSSDFFHVLFRCCVCLATLNVQHSHLRNTYTHSLSNAVPLSSSLKNIRIVDYHINFELLFSSLSKCKTLENIHICDINKTSDNRLADPSIVLENCDKLYNFYVEAKITETVRNNVLRKCNATKKKRNLSYVNVNIEFQGKHRYLYSPYYDVFKVMLLKPF